jgi:DNA-binding MarR family transcriptional regulator
VFEPEQLEDDVKKSNGSYSSVWRDLFRIVDSMRVHNSDSRDKRFFQLTFNQLRMIHRVYTYQTENNNHGISLKALAVRLGITPAAASEMVDTLVKKSVLTRSVDAVDRRAISIVVSDVLQKRFQLTEEKFDVCCQEMLDILNEEERDLFVKIVGRLAVYSKEAFETEKDGGLGE